MMDMIKVIGIFKNENDYLQTEINLCM